MKSTLTSYSSILRVAKSTADKRATSAVNEVVLTATTVNIVYVDWASASTKPGSTKGHCICGMRLITP